MFILWCLWPGHNPTAFRLGILTQRPLCRLINRLSLCDKLKLSNFEYQLKTPGEQSVNTALITQKISGPVIRNSFLNGSSDWPPDACRAVHACPG